MSQEQHMHVLSLSEMQLAVALQVNQGSDTFSRCTKSKPDSNEKSLPFHFLEKKSNFTEISMEITGYKIDFEDCGQNIFFA